MRLISHLMKDISRALQKLLKYFNGTVISTSFVLPSSVLISVIYTLSLNGTEFVKVSFGLSL